jgi:hypothetical protein
MSRPVIVSSLFILVVCILAPIAAAQNLPADQPELGSALTPNVIDELPVTDVLFNS